jgi:mannose-1-phosphate guanylyltransferase/mannose-1-phosphate guanylyltransferase/mannose-6-phosphate isomerase
MGSDKIIPVILSGGTGSRLWPQSRARHPKQFLPLAGERTLIQESVARVSGNALFAAPLIICNDEQRFLIAEQLRAEAYKPEKIVIEPVGRNTAPAAAVAALIAGKEQLILLAPADHLITDRAAFLAAIQKGVPAAQDGKLVTFGMQPTFPETGYGYIRKIDTPLGDGVFPVAEFVEKPDRATAERYIAAKTYFWNSGIFLFRADAFLRELQIHAPQVLDAARQAVAAAKSDLDFLRLDKEAFAAAPSISIDYAVMEHTKEAVVVPAEMGWTDIGSWAALWDVLEKDKDGNVLKGDVVAEASRNCYVDSPAALTTILGLTDTIVITTPDAVLVADKARAQEVRLIAERLKAEGRKEHDLHRKVHRPWGWYDSVHTGPRFQVKHIRVAPGGKLSLQKHAHRAEHWVVVSGTAIVTRDQEVLTLTENQSVYIPLGAVHRLENKGPEPLDLIEVQSGDYLGEDDIVRLEDTYNRT